MRVGLDAKRIVRNGTGLGSYGRTLVNDLIRGGAEVWLYAPDEGREELRRQVAEGARWRFATGGLRQCRSIPNHRRRGAVWKAWWRTWGVVKMLKGDGVMVYHGLSGELPIGLRKAGIHGVVTIHDLIFMRHPEYYHWVDRVVYGWKFRRTLREAERIIAISERTKADILELAGKRLREMKVGGRTLEERITVVYQSFAPRFGEAVSEERKRAVRERYGLPERFVLSVGTIERRKNLLLAVKAMGELPEEVGLVAVGRQTRYAEEVKKEGRLLMLSGVTDEELAAVYGMAEAFVYPSRYEGFGIPVIEAIAAGLPVVACTGSCLEEAGGPDCLYVGPDDVAGMAAALRRSLRGAPGREERIRRSQEYIKRFEGRSVSEQVVKLYEEVCL